MSKYKRLFLCAAACAAFFVCAGGFVYAEAQGEKTSNKGNAALQSDAPRGAGDASSGGNASSANNASNGAMPAANANATENRDVSGGAMPATNGNATANRDASGGTMPATNANATANANASGGAGDLTPAPDAAASGANSPASTTGAAFTEEALRVPSDASKNNDATRPTADASAPAHDASQNFDGASHAPDASIGGASGTDASAPVATDSVNGEASSSAPDAAQNGDASSNPVRKPLDIPIPENALVTKYRNQYTTEYAKKWLTAVMQNGAPYRGYIKATIAELGLPECLEFLPVIESSFNTNAVSRSGAVGLWQFMKNSIAPYHIRANEWMDERRDPWLSTAAALRKLKENYDTLGDWYLALAAYNAGLGGVSRTVKSNKTSDYWVLSEKKKLKNETIQYVPKFLAIADLLTNADFYGITIPDYDASAHEGYTVIETKRNMDIGIIAEECGIKNEVITFLNPSLLYGVTPPDISYGLRVPTESAEAVTALINDKSKFLIKYHRYTVRSGDTLFALALHYDVSVDMITQANPGLKPNLLKIGKTILIPAFKDVTPYAGKKADQTVTYDGVYTVQKGETLWSISLKYNVQVESLAEANNMAVDAILRIGSTLKVPIIR